MICGATKTWMRGACALRIVGLLALIALAGCGGSGAERLVVDGVERTFDLHWPQGHASPAPVPLVVALHPFTGSGPSMRRMTGLDAVADAEGFAVAYPDGWDAAGTRCREHRGRMTWRFCARSSTNLS